MKVALIYHDGEFIRVAKDYPTAIKYLINYGYIDGEDEVSPFVVVEGMPGEGHFLNGKLKEVVGENWVDLMTNHWTANDFNNFYDYWFEIVEENVIE